jgi:four helix bundle protein
MVRDLLHVVHLNEEDQMQDYRKLHVWQKAHELALQAYELPEYLRRPKCWPLRDQILKASISVPSNIAEGSGRGSDPDLCRFLWYSVGSCNEFESDLLLAHDLEFIPVPLHTRLADHVAEVRRMLTSFIRTVG